MSRNEDLSRASALSAPDLLIRHTAHFHCFVTATRHSGSILHVHMLHAPCSSGGEMRLTATHMLPTSRISLSDPKEIRVRHAAMLVMHTVACLWIISERQMWKQAGTAGYAGSLAGSALARLAISRQVTGWRGARWRMTVDKLGSNTLSSPWKVGRRSP